MESICSWPFWSVMLTSMSRLPLHALPAFRIVAELQNLRAAADVLHLHPQRGEPADPRHSKQQLGFQLFERRGRRVVLNPAGEALLRSARAALAQLDDGVRAAVAAATRIDECACASRVLPSFAQRWLLPRIGRWRERHPQLALEIDASQQRRRPAARGFHAGAALRQRAVARTRIGAAVRSTADAADRRRVAVHARGGCDGAHARSARARVAARRRASCGNAGSPRPGLRSGVTPVAVFNDAGLMLQAAEQDLGLALSRELLRRRARRRAPRCVTTFDRLRAHAHYHLVYPPACATGRRSRRCAVAARRARAFAQGARTACAEAPQAPRSAIAIHAVVRRAEDRHARERISDARARSAQMLARFAAARATSQCGAPMSLSTCCRDEQGREPR